MNETFAVGDVVDHPKFGSGVVQELSLIHIWAERGRGKAREVKAGAGRGTRLFSGTACITH